jgi:hypothetical protein
MINVITSFKGGWILKRLAEGIVSRVPGTRLVDEADRATIFGDDARINYYVNDWCMSVCGKNPKAQNVVFLDHPKGDRYLKQADHIIAMTPQYARYAREQLGKETHLIIQPTDTEVYVPKLRIGFIGRFKGRTDYGKRKGRALIEHVRELPYVDLHMTMGQVADDDMPEFYRGLDYVLVPALVEGGPMCLTEGLACGVKIICPRTVGIAEMFPEGIINYRCGDWDSLKSVLDRLYQEKMRLHDMVAEYTWDKWAKEHERVFAQMARHQDVCVYTTCIGEYGEALGAISMPLMQAWAARHGYRFHAFREQGDHVTPSWVRMDMCAHMRAHGYRYGIYLDLDTVVNPAAPDLIDQLPKGGWDIAAWNHGDDEGWDTRNATGNIRDYCRYAGIDAPKNYTGRDYFNAGVIVVTDKYLDWIPGWPESPHGCQDQNALNLAVIRGDLRWYRLGHEWNYGHMSSIPPDIYKRAHVVHCNQPTLAPCQMSNTRERLMCEAAALVGTRKRPRVLMATVVAGEAYEAIYELTRQYHEAYAAAHGYDYRAIFAPVGEWPSPSWWKMDLYYDLDQYDAVVVLDCDAWPWYGAPSIVDAVPRGKFGAFNSMSLEYMARDDSDAISSYKRWTKAAKVKAYDPMEQGYYVNAAVFVCWKEAREALRAPLEPVEVPFFFEQHTINHNLYENPGLYHELGQEWNRGHLHRPGAVDAVLSRETYIGHLSGLMPRARLPLMRALIEQRAKAGNNREPVCANVPPSRGYLAFRERRGVGGSGEREVFSGVGR